ncbi:hypothetical protein LCGC14_1471530 [marine sediment metagenome]|uniref:Uncharacterized protein n=1 Tax=marine sediment metagenome TaxID=412755 RepID=A0A0F9JY75_9ZZZZ
MKLLRPIAGTAGVFFPLGKLIHGGTCEFATDICLKKCVVVWDQKYDEEYCVPKEERIEIYQAFRDWDENTLSAQIFKEMQELQTNILHWFASGDCTSLIEDKIVKIISILWNEGNVIHHGFTRNRHFWDRVNFSTNIVLTCEKIEDIPDIHDHIYAVPNYQKKITYLYHHGEGNTKHFVGGGCGGGYYTYDIVTKKLDIPCDINEVMSVNCKRCYKRKEGCFYEPKDE